MGFVDCVELPRCIAVGTQWPSSFDVRASIFFPAIFARAAVRNPSERGNATGELVACTGRCRHCYGRRLSETHDDERRPHKVLRAFLTAGSRRD